MAELIERTFECGRDVPALLRLTAEARDLDPHAFVHPGGLQWLLRGLGRGEFAVWQWFDGEALAGVVVNDSGFVISQPATVAADQNLWLLAQAETRLRDSGHTTIETSAWDDDRDLVSRLHRERYESVGTYSHEFVYELSRTPPEARVPEGFSIRWLEPALDDAYVELHRAAWSTWGPSTYDLHMHRSVTSMPDFERELVPIVVGPNGNLVASCIVWFDPRTRTAEIEPLGTHPDFRRVGLARAVVDEAVRRSALWGARSVMVWGTSRNVGALRLYASAGFRSRRLLREYRRLL